MALGKTMNTTTLLYGIVGVVVLFYVVTALIPELQHSLNNVAALDIPLASFFGGSGVLMLALVAGIVIATISYFIGHGKGR